MTQAISTSLTEALSIRPQGGEICFLFPHTRKLLIAHPAFWTSPFHLVPSLPYKMYIDFAIE